MENREIKILLTSDIHLGLDVAGMPVPEKARISTFKRIMNLAKEHDILLIAGDLINNVSASREILDTIRAEFNVLRENNVEILLTPGPGELTPDKNIAPFLFDLRATYIFTSPEAAVPYSFVKDEQRVYFYGIPSSYSQDIAKIKKTSTDGFHIGLFHVEFDIDSTGHKESVFKLHKRSLKKLELDFYALGHNHNFKMFKVADRIIGTYPGSPEATGFAETGDRYVISISLKNNEIFHIKRLSVNSVRLCDSVIDCSAPESQNVLHRTLDEQKAKNVVHRITLTGFRDYILNRESIDQYRNMYLDIVFIDNSIPTVNAQINEYSSGTSLRGDFYKNLREDIKNGRVSPDANLDTLAELLHRVSNDGYDHLEEWLCG